MEVSQLLAVEDSEGKLDCRDYDNSSKAEQACSAVHSVGKQKGSTVGCSLLTCPSQLHRTENNLQAHSQVKHLPKKANCSASNT